MSLNSMNQSVFIMEIKCVCLCCHPLNAEAWLPTAIHVRFLVNKLAMEEVSL